MITMLDMVKPLPYVSRIDTLAVCEGWRGPKKKCLNRAMYAFKKGSGKGPGRHKSGWYCSDCLRVVLVSSVYERKRFNRYHKRAGTPAE